MTRRFPLLLLLLAAAACAGWYWYALRPDPARPALWRVQGTGGQSAWLFGTTHALPRPARWRTPPVAAALADSDELVVEVERLGDDAATARAFAALAHTPGLPPLDQRVEPALRPALAAALARIGKRAQDFTDTESWAAALTLARAEATGDPANGIDRALLATTPLPVAELEGATGQLSLFDRLPEPAQRRLLAASLADDGADPLALATAWRQGNIALIAQQTHTGILADPVLREALYTARNRAWLSTITALMRQGRHPFVAVGTAHLAGDDAIPALLAAQGYRVTRVE